MVAITILIGTDKLLQVRNQTMKETHKMPSHLISHMSNRLNLSRKKLSLIGIALLSFPASTFFSLSSTPPVTAAGLCPGQKIDSARIPGLGRVDLYYSGGTNCAVTFPDDPFIYRYMNVFINPVGSATKVVVPGYRGHAGPVKVYAPKTCIYWGGQIGIKEVKRGPGHCN
jgi:hypothetical protein